MVFSSLIFLFLFLPLVLVAYYIVPSRFKNIIMLIASIIFYAWGEPVYVYLMLISIVINYFGALLVRRNNEDEEKHKFIFITIILINVSMLMFFKYYGFLIENINNVLDLNLQIRKLPLPLGISFFTFQLISYVADIYTGRSKPQKNIINFATYIAMFPQLVAGPIVQYNDVEKQLVNREENFNKFGEGVNRLIIGLGKKVLIANNIALIWGEIKNLPLENISVVSAWLGIIAFTLQIYFDFSGYSDMAIGLGKMFGFDFIENFNFSYTSKSVTEFWRRWNISLGSWFREYIYIPLGGNRKGLLIQFRNLMIVWFATGLWHGASWSFIFWGVYFGLIIFAEKIFLSKILEKTHSIVQHIYTMVLVIIGWVFFDLGTLSSAWKYIGVMFGLGDNLFINNLDKYLIGTNFILLFISILFCTKFVRNINRKMNNKLNKKYLIFSIVIQSLILISSVAFLVSESYNPFLYFRF